MKTGDVNEAGKELLTHLLQEHGGMGGFSNEENITVTEEEVIQLAVLEVDWMVSVIREQLWNLDWIERVKQLREESL
jgi:hypothetical protein